MSAIKFPTKMKTELIRLIPKRRGMSPFIPAATIALPSHGYENTFSTRVEPPKISPRDAN